MTWLDSTFDRATDQIYLAVGQLERLVLAYTDSALPRGTITARVAAINAKIDALKAIKLDPRAHPWVEDGV